MESNSDDDRHCIWSAISLLVGVKAKTAKEFAEAFCEVIDDGAMQGPTGADRLRTFFGIIVATLILSRIVIIILFALMMHHRQY